MKKIVFFISIIMLITCLYCNKKEVLIPKEAIRIRVIANSNSVEDQKNKTIVKNEVNSILYGKLQSINNYEDAKKVLKENIDIIDNEVNKYTDNYEISYGKNPFPSKSYKGVTYEKGEYESLVIKLGEGKGRNFWCVLFPPLCMIDESKLNNVSYSFFVNELLKKIK